jgi:hypothetical protein
MPIIITIIIVKINPCVNPLIARFSKLNPLCSTSAIPAQNIAQKNNPHIYITISCLTIPNNPIAIPIGIIPINVELRLLILS